MKLTTKGRYAVTAMLDLSLHTDVGQPVTIADIAQRQSLSVSYLEQLFSKLRKHGLVQSIRGPGGGYLLGSEPENIHVANIINAVDEKVDATGCGGKENCTNAGRCLTHELWQSLSNQINVFLEGISLADLLNNHKKQESVVKLRPALKGSNELAS